MRSISHAILLAAALLGGSAMLAAQQPKVVNAQLSTQSVDRSLQATLDQLRQSAAPLWVGYTIPTGKPFNNGWGSSQVAYLEGNHYSQDGSEDKNTSRQDHAVILYRLSSGKVEKVRVEAVDRQMDAGGLRFVWLANVTPEESVAALKALCTSPDTASQINSAVFLISLHQSAAAMPALIALAGPGSNSHLREQAAFWLSSGRGHEGFLALQNLARTDKDDDFRFKLAFDFNVSKDPAALDELVRMAHDDASPRVRSQAQFWLASRGGRRIAASLRDSADNDPDAQTRKQAVFWLGQSKDPKALEYLTKLVTAPARQESHE